MKFMWKIFDRLLFVILIRNLYKKKFKGFYASPLSYIDKETNLSEYNVFHGRCVVVRSTVERYTYAVNARIVNSKVGKFCSIGPETLIGGLGRHPTQWLSTHPIFYSLSKQVGISFAIANHFEELPCVEIGNDVWIGARVVILDGVKIGDGSIIAAGAIVTSDVAPYSIVGGVPARLIRQRMPNLQASMLIELAWWNWSEEKLRKAAPLFTLSIDDSVISSLEKINSEG